MSTVAPVQNTSGSGEVFKILSGEEQIRQRLEAERKRLEQEAGIERRRSITSTSPSSFPSPRCSATTPPFCSAG